MAGSCKDIIKILTNILQRGERITHHVTGQRKEAGAVLRIPILQTGFTQLLAAHIAFEKNVNALTADAVLCPRWEKVGAVANAELPSKLALQNNKNDSTELNAVAFDPNYQNGDGTKGANVVMSKADAQAKGLTHPRQTRPS